MKISELWKQVSIQMFEQILLCLISKKFISSSECSEGCKWVFGTFSFGYLFVYKKFRDFLKGGDKSEVLKTYSKTVIKVQLTVHHGDESSDAESWCFEKRKTLFIFASNCSDLTKFITISV